LVLKSRLLNELFRKLMGYDLFGHYQTVKMMPSIYVCL